MARQPDKTESHVVSGIWVQFAYYYRRRDVTVHPDPSDVAAASAAAVIRMWLKIADWAGRFSAANPGWKVNGAYHAETLGE